MTLSAKEKHRLRTQYGPWALVTGASSGIGREIATQLAQAGLNLVLNARGQEGLSELKTSLQACPIEIKTVAADVGDPVGRAQLLQVTQSLELGLLVAAAGFGSSGNFLETELSRETGMIRVNCEALFMLTHHFSQKFAAQKRGGIILLSSMVAFQGVPYSANYAATKAYVQSLAEALARELNPYQVDVLAAAPGPVASAFAQRANMQMSMSLTPAQVGIPILRALGRKTTVLPGFLTKLLVYALRTVPRWAKVRIMEGVMGGMTRHQRHPAVEAKGA